MTIASPTMAEALVRQQAACAALGSPLYARILEGVIDDYDRGGIVSELLDARTERPARDAVPLRLLGAVHRLVLERLADDLARFYPSAGGDDSGDSVPAFLSTLVDHRHAIGDGLSRTVQTNEVGRAAALAPAFAAVARRTGLPLHLLEIGASSGLLLQWDRFWYDSGRSHLGDDTSAVRFEPGTWLEPAPDLGGFTSVAERRGVDIAPIDPTTSDGRLTLLSFVWPDQSRRLERLDAAIAIATRHPVVVDRGDGGRWAGEQLADSRPGVATVLYHSIVLQYLDRDSLDRLRGSLDDCGRRATASAPLTWLRMEPAGPVADIRLTMWPGGDEELLGTCGYHGQDVCWRP
jgi:hypothetical protein